MSLGARKGLETLARAVCWRAAAHSRILASRIPWTEEPGGLLSIGSHRVRHDCSDLAAAAAAGDTARREWEAGGQPPPTKLSCRGQGGEWLGDPGRSGFDFMS